MRLHQHFFLWIVISTIIPLTVLILGLTVYGERLYRQQISQEINASLNNIATDLERDLAHEHQLMMGVVQSPALLQYLPVLSRAAVAEIHPEFEQRSAVLNRFLLTFNNIVHSQGTLRVLDLQGNTLIKVGLGRVSAQAYEGIEGFAYAEQERDEYAEMLSLQLQELPDDEVSFIALPQAAQEQMLLDGVVPLNYQGERVGYLTTSLLGEQLDYTLQLAPRLYEGRLLLLESNPENAARDGRILYDDDASLLFADTEQTPAAKSGQSVKKLLQVMQAQPDGVISVPDSGSSMYYTEMYPYPDHLLSWVLAVRVDEAVIGAPFKRLRYGILLFAGMVLLTGLVTAQLGARHITRPVLALVKNLRALARGLTPARIKASGADELVELNDAFEDLQQGLQAAETERDQARSMAAQNAKLACIGQLAAGIGHELNNPLTNILSYTKLIERELDKNPDTVRNDLLTLREEGERASRIVEGILNFSRQVPARFAEFSVQAWLAQTVGLVQATARERGVEISWPQDADFSVTGDRVLLQQALINLLINAIHVSPDGGRVQIMVQRQPQTWVISVQDQGPGIDPAIMGRLFEPFFTTKEVGEGAGLGLSITLGIVEQHGGALKLENGPGEAGVTAAMALPLTPLQPAEADV